MRRLNPGRSTALLYLLAALTGFFSYMYVKPALIVYRDAAATARNILASENLYRAAIVSELISSVAFIFLVLALYQLFREAGQRLGVVMVILVLVSIPVSLLNTANLVIALKLAKGGTSELQTMALLFLRIHDASLIIAQIFWGLWLIPLGMLIRRSGFVPRILGTLLIFNGIAYPVTTLIWLLLPAYTTIAFRIALIPELGEGWFIFWLLIKGVPAKAVDDREEHRSLRSAFAPAALMMVMAFFCATAGAQPKNAQAVYEQGRKALLRGEPQQAVTYFTDAIALRPGVARYHDQLANACAQSALSAGMFERMSIVKRAKEEWERAVQLDPNFIEARQSLVDFYLMAPAIMGGGDAAAREQAAEIRKRDAIEGHRALARIDIADKQPDLARNEYAEMLKTHPTSARAHYWYGVHLMLTEKNYVAAVAAFESAVKLDPAYMPAYYQIGHAAALTGESLARGEEALKKYLAYGPKEDEPTLARAHYWLGGIYEKQHRKPQAKANYAASLAINPNQKDVQAALKGVDQ
ncbi:MAG TPA: DUF4386 family protein [Thermoanaerobaculia bacterium]|jgi:tetratricopeptide (TPR) repeat protein|nr:DUF4386 family protein [Thermoanaerobaculia bacterium]